MKRLTTRDESGYYHLRRGPNGGEINKITVVQHLGRLEDVALRPVSREQVETAWKGCKHCTEEWGTCDPITNRFRMPPRGAIQFCPMCGRPLTGEAVEMVMERLEALNE